MTEQDGLPYEDFLEHVRVYYVPREVIDWVGHEIMTQTDFEIYTARYASGVGDADWNEAEAEMYWCMGRAKEDGKYIVWFKEESNDSAG